MVVVVFFWELKPHFCGFLVFSSMLVTIGVDTLRCVGNNRLRERLYSKPLCSTIWLSEVTLLPRLIKFHFVINKYYYIESLSVKDFILWQLLNHIFIACWIVNNADILNLRLTVGYQFSLPMSWNWPHSMLDGNALLLLPDVFLRRGRYK